MYQTLVIQNKCLGKKITLKMSSIQVTKELGISAMTQAQKVHSRHCLFLPGPWRPGCLSRALVSEEWPQQLPEGMLLTGLLGKSSLDTFLVGWAGRKELKCASFIMCVEAGRRR